MTKKQKKIKRVCFDCANLVNGRIKFDKEDKFWSTPILDGKYKGKTYRASPSHSRLCHECGKKVKDFMEFEV